MNSEKFSSNISKPLITENVKRFWIGSLLAFLGYFFSCCMPIIMSGSRLHWRGSVISFSYPPVAVLICIVPVIAALLIYRYMQQQSSASIVHALPFSRKQLFHSSFISGMILCIAPIILTAIILTLLSLGQPTAQQIFDPVHGFMTVKVFSVVAIWKWTLFVSVMTAAVFTVCIFAAVLTGSTLIQLFMSLALLGIIPLLLIIIQSFGEIMLYGYIVPDWISDVIAYVCPVGGAVMGISVKHIICYAVWGLALYVFSYFLYGRRPVEKATDTLIFNTSKPICKYVFTFLTMSLLAFFTYSLSGGHEIYFMYIGAAAGALIGYVIVDMLIQKKLKIKGFVKGFGIFAVLAVIFFAGYNFDVVGFEKNLPDISKVDHINIGDVHIYFTADNAPDGAYVAEDKAVAEEVLAMHQDLIDDKAQLEGASYENFYGRSTIITYYLENGRTLKRNYYANWKWLNNNMHNHNIRGSLPYKAGLYPIVTKDISKMDISNITVNATYESAAFGGSSGFMYSDVETLNKITKAIQEDIKNLDASQIDPDGYSPARYDAEITIKTKNANRIDPELNRQYYAEYGQYYDEEFNYDSYSINRYYTNTLEVFKELGIYDSVVLTAEDVDYATVSVYNAEAEKAADAGKYHAEVASDEASIVQPTVKGVRITDKAQIQNIIDTARLNIYNYEDYYEVILYPYGGRGNDGDYIYLYYDMDEVPQFLIDAIAAEGNDAE